MYIRFVKFLMEYKSLFVYSDKDSYANYSPRDSIYKNKKQKVTNIYTSVVFVNSKFCIVATFDMQILHIVAKFSDFL